MKFTPAAIAGAFIIETEPRSDARGSFARLFCPQEFAAAGLDFASSQISLATSTLAFTLRGMHFNAAPYEEAKLVRCIRGAIFEVAIDLRRGSSSYRQWIGVELSSANQRALLVPRGCAQGYLTLVDACEVLYQIDRLYQPGADRGVRWNDPAFAIAWPHEPRVMNERDATFPDHAV